MRTTQVEIGGNLITIDGRAHDAFSASYEYMRVAEGVWLPTREVHRADTSLPLTLFPVSILAQHQDHWELEYAYTNYKRFRADSQVVAIGEAAEPHWRPLLNGSLGSCLPYGPSRLRSLSSHERTLGAASLSPATCISK